MRTLRTHSLAASLSFTFALGLVAACDEVESEEVSLRPGTGWGCATCSSGLGNSPVVDNVPIHGLPLDGAVNAEGVALVGGRTGNGQDFALAFDVTSEEFYGTDADGAVLFTPAEMVGKGFVLNVGGKERLIRFSDRVAGVPSWATGGAPITVYRGVYTTTQGAEVPLCPSADPNQQWFTLLGDEVYDRNKNTLQAAPGWVSFACVSEALGKMKLFDYHKYGSYGSSPKERVATLRMVSADYCGSGDHFTVSGTQVAWRDTADTVPPPFAENRLEALWNEKGAICLNTPRLVARSVVAAKCNIPTCPETDDVVYPAGTVWRTMLP